MTPKSIWGHEPAFTSTVSRMFRVGSPGADPYHTERTAVKKRTEIAAGIDTSRSTLWVMAEGQSEVRQYGNDDVGHRALIADLTRGGRRVRVVVEATGTYHLDLAMALSNHRLCRVSVINPRSSKHFHEAQNRRAKTDTVDAKSLCEYARRMEFVEWTQPDEVALTLRALTRHQAQLTKERTRAKNHAHALDVSKTTPKVLHDMVARQLAFIDSELEQVKALLDQFVADNASLAGQVKLLETIPGVGRTTALHLLSAFLLLDQEMGAKEITAWAGLDPRPQDSGTVERRRAISKRGSSRIRAALYFPAVTAARMEGPLRQFHERIADRKGLPMTGILALMRKILTVSWAIHRTGSAWDATKVMPAGRSNPITA